MQSLVRKLLAAACLVSGSPACLQVPGEIPEEPNEERTAPTTAAELLTRHIQAIGGEAALRAIDHRTIEARILLHKQDDCTENDPSCVREDQTGSFFMQNTADGHMYQRTVLGESVQERGFDGKQGWSLSGNALRVDTPEEAELTRDDARLHWYFDLDARAVEVTLLEPRSEDSEGRVITLDGLRWEIRGVSPPKELWFERTSGLLREEITQDGIGKDSSGEVVIHEDYRPTDGVLISNVVRVIHRAGARKQVYEVITQRADHAAIDASKFAAPVLPEPAPEADPLLSQLHRAEAAAKAADADRATLVEWARVAFRAGHFEEAASAAEATLAVDAREPEALVILARVQVMAGRHDEALKSLVRAEKAGVREDVIARERAWVHHRTREFGKLAADLDVAGNAVLAGRYRSFVGKPLAATFTGNTCTAELELLDADPLAVVRAKVGERAIGLIFDTGAAALILTETQAAALDVTIRARTHIADGIPDIGHGQIDAIELGPLTLRNVPVDVFDDVSIAQMAGEHEKLVEGVLGATALREFVIGVDVGERKLSLARRDGKCKPVAQGLLRGPSAALWQHESHYLYVLGKMNGAEGMYLLNTGMRGADLTANQAAYAYAGIGVPTLRSDESPTAIVRKFELPPGVAWTDLRAAYGLFQPTQTSSGFRLDGMIGLGTLGSQPFVLDFEQQRIHFPSRPVPKDAAPGRE